MCRTLTKPAYFDEKGNRGVDNGDGTVTWGSLESAAPKAVRRFLKHVDYITIHTTRSRQRHTIQIREG